MQAIKLSTDQMRMMSLFQNVTGATARDCVEDEKQDRVIFVVNTGKMGLAIGKGGMHIKSLQNMVKRNVELVEFDEDPAKFLTNLLNNKLVSEVKLNCRIVFSIIPRAPEYSILAPSRNKNTIIFSQSIGPFEFHNKRNKKYIRRFF